MTPLPALVPPAAAAVRDALLPLPCASLLLPLSSFFCAALRFCSLSAHACAYGHASPCACCLLCCHVVLLLPCCRRCGVLLLLLLLYRLSMVAQVCRPQQVLSE